MKKHILVSMLVVFSVMLTGCGSGGDGTVDNVDVTTRTMPIAIYGEEYTENIEVTGGQGNYTVSLIGGELPAGLNLGSEGSVSGVAASRLAPHIFRVRAEDRDFTENYDEQEITITVKLTGPDKYEPDDDFNTENTITFDGVEQKHTIDKDGKDRDFIKLDLTGAGDQTLKIQTCFAKIPADTLLRIYDANRELLVTDDNSGNDMHSRIVYDFSEGVYYIMISAADGKPGDYTISVMPAVSISTQNLGYCIQKEAYTAQIIAAGGVADTEYNFSLVSGNLPADLSLSADGIVSGTPSGAIRTYSFRVEVEDKNDIDNYTEKEISLDLQLTGADNQEPDDDFETENTITYNGVDQRHTIDHGDDQDYIKLDLTTIPVDTRMIIETSFVSFATDTLLKIYNGNGEVLATDDNSGTDLLSRIEYSFSQGSYYIMVSTADGRPGDYAISVKLNYRDLKMVDPTAFLVEGFASKSYYDKIEEVEGGTGCYVYSLVGSLPEGLNLDTSTGEVSGTLDADTHDVYSFDIMVSDLYYPNHYSIQRNIKLPVYECQSTVDDRYKWAVLSIDNSDEVSILLYWDGVNILEIADVSTTVIFDVNGESIYVERGDEVEHFYRGELIEEYGETIRYPYIHLKTSYFEVFRCGYPVGFFDAE